MLGILAPQRFEVDIRDLLRLGAARLEAVAIDKDVVQFRRGRPDPISERMVLVAARNDGLEWVNLQPWVDPDELPKVSLLRHIFSAKGQPVPTGTWVPGHTAGKEPTLTEVGIQHGFGVGALARLNEQAVAIPADWNVIQEDTRRGLVFSVARGQDPAVALNFMVSACAALSGVETDDRWLAGFCMRAGTGTPAG